MEASVIKVGVVNIDVCISSHLKEELPWAVDKRLRVIRTIMFCYLKNSKSVKEIKTKDNIVYIVMWTFVMYSNYSEIVSTVTLLVLRIGLI